MTSNLGSDLILDAGEKMTGASQGDVGKIQEELRSNIDLLLKKTFRPEFLNRIDEIVMFSQLGKEHIAGIVRNQLERVAARLADRRITLKFDDSAVSFLSEKGYEPTMGARPVKRAIQTYVENQLAKELLAGKFGEDSVISVKAAAGGQGLEFTKA